MPSNPLGLRLTAIELAQREGARLAPYDQGVLIAARRTGDPELSARVDNIRRVEEIRQAKRRQRAKRRQEEDR